MEITTAAEIRTVWYPKLNTYNNDVAKKLYRSIDETPDVTFWLDNQRKKSRHTKMFLLYKQEIYMTWS